MPRRKVNLIKKQKQLIATRLMQISLLVDDYLYQQKPMSQRSAAAYIREISGYKNKCYQDVRSLQVIEKLTRCITGIIHEQEELHGEYCEDLVFPLQDFTQGATNVILSPVYSTVDEDLTQYVEIDEDIIICEKMQENEDNYNKYEDDGILQKGTINKDPLQYSNGDTNKINEGKVNDNTQTDKDPLPNDLKVIELCDDEIEELIGQTNATEPDFNIQNAISHLSIRDIEEALIPFSQDCSQSILNSYYTNPSLQNVVPLTIDYDAITAIHQIPVTETRNQITKIVLPRKPAKRIQKPGNKPTAGQNVYKNKTAPKENAQVSKPVPQKRNTKNNYNNVKTVKNNTTSKKQAQKKAKAVDIKQLKPETVQTYANTPSHSEFKAGNTEKSLTYSKTQLSTENLTDKTRVTQNKIQNNYKDLSIYNKTVVNDLSWIENIRFVREIPSEEYESFTENEVFWQNYTLPYNFNENDFNY